MEDQTQSDENSRLLEQSGQTPPPTYGITSSDSIELAPSSSQQPIDQNIENDVEHGTTETECNTIQSIHDQTQSDENSRLLDRSGQTPATYGTTSSVSSSDSFELAPNSSQQPIDQNIENNAELGTTETEVRFASISTSCWTEAKTIFTWLSTASALVILTSISLLLLHEFILYLRRYLGDQSHIVEVIAYEQFNMQLFAPPVIILLSTLISCFARKCECGQKLKSYWFSSPAKCARCDEILKPYMFSLQALPTTVKIFKDNVFHKKNANCCSITQNICQFLLLCLAPIGNIILMGFIFRAARNMVIDSYKQVGEYPHWCLITMKLFRSGEIPGVFIYGCFVLILYMNRKNYQYHFGETAIKIAEEEHDNVEVCRAVITQKWVSLREYRNIIGWWLCYTLTIGVLAMAIQIVWLRSEDFQDYDEDTVARLVEVGMACQNIMLVMYPLFAVGSYNVDIIWYYFKEECKYHMKRAEQQQHLQVILDHASKIRSTGPWLFTTLIFSIGTVFAAITFPDQFTNFGIRPNCNATLINLVNAGTIIL